MNAINQWNDTTLSAALTEQPSLMLAFYSFGVMLRKTDGGVTHEFPVNPAQIALALAAKVTFDTGLLGGNTLLVRQDGVKRTVGSYRPPAKTGVFLEGWSRRCACRCPVWSWSAPPPTAARRSMACSPSSAGRMRSMCRCSTPPSPTCSAPARSLGPRPAGERCCPARHIGSRRRTGGACSALPLATIMWNLYWCQVFQ